VDGVGGPSVARAVHTIHRHYCYDGDDRHVCLRTEGANPIEQESTETN